MKEANQDAYNYVKAVYANTPAKVIAAHTGYTVRHIYKIAYLLGLKKSDEFLASPESGRFGRNEKGQIIAGLPYQFKKGQQAWNKGKKMPGTGDVETIFKKGHIPYNTKHDNAITIRTDKKSGKKYKFIRVALAKWEFLHRQVWRDHFGEIPDGMIIRFKDGNTLNCDIDNLMMIDRKTNVQMNSIHRYPDEIKGAIRAVGTLNRKLNKLSKHGTK